MVFLVDSSVDIRGHFWVRISHGRQVTEAIFFR